MRESEDIGAADVDAAAAMGARRVADDRPRAALALERQRDHLRLRADGEAVGAVVATAAVPGASSGAHFSGNMFPLRELPALLKTAWS